MNALYTDFQPKPNIALSPFGYWPRRHLVWRSRLRMLFKFFC